MKLKPPFRAEHIGSLLRPRQLKDAFGARSRGDLGEADYLEILERFIVEAIRLQEDAGLQSITDGEFRRVAWSTGFVSALDGLDTRQSIFEFRDEAGNSQHWDTVLCNRTAQPAACNRAPRIRVRPAQHQPHAQSHDAGAELPAFLPPR